MRIRVSAVYEANNSILCMKYIYGGQPVYALPGGGVDKGRPVLEALRAEWKEELGVKLEAGPILLVGEAPAAKRHPQTLHLIFLAAAVHGTPKVRPQHTHSQEVFWLPLGELGKCALYPDVGGRLAPLLAQPEPKTIDFVANCMERGYW